MLFDLNGFLGPWPFWQVRHQTPKSVLTLMDRHGIDVLAVCATRSILSDWKLGNEETIQAATHNPNRFVAFVSISPILPASELVRQLESYKRAGVKGIRLYPQHQSYSLTGLAGSSVILQKAQELSLSVVLPIRAIMQWGLPELDTGTIEAVVTRHPRLTFILSGVNYSKTLWAYDLVRRRHNVSRNLRNARVSRPRRRRSSYRRREDLVRQRLASAIPGLQSCQVGIGQNHQGRKRGHLRRQCPQAPENELMIRGRGSVRRREFTCESEEGPDYRVAQNLQSRLRRCLHGWL